ncbi:MAG: type I-E CRISPR-associated protein Cas7/Cse4/CasC, partial [Candidatus Brocadiia bacterium]
MFVELHMLQNFAPHCLNRDDTNTPKDCEFGGYRRARISSQCLKRAARTSPVFEETLGSATGLRTKLLVHRLTELISDEGKEPETCDAVVPAFVNAVAGKMKAQKTSVLLYLGEDEINRMADLLLERWDELADLTDAEDKLGDLCKEIASSFESGTKAADIALFGRMVAENTDMNVDAASQVAHAISTHAVNMEMDFYTAVDDLQPSEEPGASMMGVTQFNSSCFYRYALVDLNQLVENLDKDEELARAAVEAFLRAAIAAIPSGKQNSMAAHNPPSFIMAVARDGSAPWSLANAFVHPARPRNDRSLVQDSAAKLAGYWYRLA